MKKQKLLKYIPTRHKIGVIIRIDDNIARLDLIKKAIEQLLTINKIDLIHVMIYKPNPENDIWNELIKLFGKERKKVQFERITTGNFYGDLLNYAKNEQIRRGIDYSISISPEAYLYATDNNISKMLEAAEKGSYATCLKLKEYSELIESGYISNAFCMYRNSVINFVNIWELNQILQKTSDDKKSFGLEETYVIKNLIDTYEEKCVTVITPKEGHLIEATDKSSIEKRDLVKKTKKERFHKICNLLKVNPQYFIDNIIWK